MIVSSRYSSVGGLTLAQNRRRRYALRDQFGWIPKEDKPSMFTSDIQPHELSSSFTSRQGVLYSFNFLITDIAPEEARGGFAGGMLW